MDQQSILRRPFDLETHKQNFTNYLEVIVLEDGSVAYAVPSHQEKLIVLACKKLDMTRKQLEDFCPENYHYDFITWLCMVSGCIALWNDFMVGAPNDKQLQTIGMLIEEGLFRVM